MSDTDIHNDGPINGSQNNLLDNEVLPDENLFESPEKNPTKEISTDKVVGLSSKLVTKDKNILSPINASAEEFRNESKKEIEEKPTELDDEPSAVVHRLITIEPAIFFTVCAMSLQMVTSSSLTIDKVCRVTYNYSDSICNNFTHYPNTSDKIQSQSADLIMYRNLIETIPAVLYALFLGSWSDKHSRKFPIMFPALGYLFCSICNMFFAYFTHTPPEYILISSVFIGLTGGMVSTIMGTFSYISDITSQQNRTSRIVIVDFALTLSFPTGMLLSSVVYGQWGFVPVYVTCAVLALTSLLYTTFFVRETIHFVNNGRRCSVFWDMFDIQNVLDNLKICTTSRPGNNRIYVNFMSFCMFILMFPTIGESSVMLLFVERKFDWNQIALGYYSTYDSVISVIATALLYQFVLKKLRLQDLALGILGFFGTVVKEVIISVSVAPWMLYLSATVSFYNFFGSPAVRAFGSKLVAKDEVGKLFAVISSCESLTPIFASIVYSQLYKATDTTFPGAVFILSTGLTIIPLIIFIWIYFDKRKDDNYKQIKENKKEINNPDLS